MSAFQRELAETGHQDFYGEVGVTAKILDGVIQAASIHRETKGVAAPPKKVILPKKEE